ncbi:MAG: tetratricopeptide repeat protein [candidate division Zixibacteria bacterium]|nr:tetratricopeptide repeat protein [candidate division Zixibacteria bacterium]
MDIKDEKTLEELESRFAEIEKSGDVTPEKMEILNQIAEKYVVDDPRKAIEITAETQRISREINYSHGIAYGLGIMGYAYYMLSDFEKAIKLFTEALRLGDEHEHRAGRARILVGLASVYLSMGSYEKSLSYALSGLKVLKEIGDMMHTAWTLQGIGTAYHELKDFDRSLQYHRESMELFEKLKSVKDSLAGKARNLVGIGSVYQSNGEYDKAREYYEQSLPLFIEAGNRIGEARVYHDLATLCHITGDFDIAHGYFLKALNLRRQAGNRQAQCTTLISLGKLYVQQGKSDEALDVLNESLSIASEIKARPRIYMTHEALSAAYEQKGDLAGALEHQRLFHSMKEEVLGEETNSRLKNLEISYEVERAEKEAEIERLKNVELKEKNERLESLLDELHRTQNQLIQTEKMAALGSLVAGVVHELNSPVGVLKSSADVTRRSMVKLNSLARSMSIEDKDFERSLQTVMENTELSASALQRIVKIVSDLKSFIRLDGASLEKYDIHKGLESVLSLLEHEISEGIVIKKDYGEIPKIVCNPGELNQVFFNLIKNALEAFEQRGTITIRTSSIENKIKVMVEDNGEGIPGELIDRIFEPGFSRKGERVKAGMGLFACYNIIEKHAGRINVESEKGKGSRFTIELPVSLERRLDSDK